MKLSAEGGKAKKVTADDTVYNQRQFNFRAGNYRGK